MCGKNIETHLWGHDKKGIRRTKGRHPERCSG